MIPRVRLAALLPVLLLAACGQDDSSQAAAGNQVPVRDTTVPPIERQPLTQADQVGLEPFDLAVELPWTGNRLSRDPADGSPRARVTGIETLAADGFDRVVFSFAGGTPFPGYMVRLVETPSQAGCDPEDGALPAEGPLLVVRVAPVRPGEGNTLSPGMAGLGQSRFQEAGVACMAGDALIWAAGISGGEQMRVLELRNPMRLSVDLR